MASPAALALVKNVYMFDLSPGLVLVEGGAGGGEAVGGGAADPGERVVAGERRSLVVAHRGSVLRPIF